MEYNGRFYAHLFFAILLSAVKPEHMVLTVGQAGTESLSIDDVEIPLQNKGFFLIPFHGPHGTYRYISAADILKGTTETREIEGHIVIIGSGSARLIGYPRYTNRSYNGWGRGARKHHRRHLVGWFSHAPKAAVVYEFIAIVFLGLLSTILSARRKAIINLTFLFLLTLVVVILTVFTLPKWNLSFSSLPNTGPVLQTSPYYRFSISGAKRGC